MRLIDADALMKEAGRLWSEMPDGEELSKDLMKAINHAPTVATDTNVLCKWISVKDRLPDECGEYLIRDKMGVTIALLIDNEKGIWQWQDSDFYGRGGITHWMKIPELPEEDK